MVVNEAIWPADLKKKKPDGVYQVRITQKGKHFDVKKIIMHWPAKKR